MILILDRFSLWIAAQLHAEGGSRGRHSRRGLYLGWNIKLMGAACATRSSPDLSTRLVRA